MAQKLSKSCGLTLRTYKSPYTAEAVKDIVNDISYGTEELISQQTTKINQQSQRQQVQFTDEYQTPHRSPTFTQRCDQDTTATYMPMRKYDN